MTKRESIIDKVRKVLTLANRASNEHEAAAAAAVAQRFMAEHDLCIEDIGEVSEEDLKIIKEDVYSSGRLATWRMRLLQHVAACFNCAILINSNPGRRKNSWYGDDSYPGSKTLILVGTSDDISAARAVNDYLSEVVERLAKANAHGNGRSYVNSYKQGMTSRLGQRLKAQSVEIVEEVKEHATSAGTELVVVKNANLKSFMASYGPSKRSYGNRNIDYAGYHAGKRDADHVSLNRQLEEGK